MSRYKHWMMRCLDAFGRFRPNLCKQWMSFCAICPAQDTRQVLYLSILLSCYFRLISRETPKFSNNIILIQYFYPVGRSFFSSPSLALGAHHIAGGAGGFHQVDSKLGGGREVWFGFHQSVRPSQWKMMLNIDGQLPYFSCQNADFPHFSQIFSFGHCLLPQNARD